MNYETTVRSESGEPFGEDEIGVVERDGRKRRRLLVALAIVVIVIAALAAFFLMRGEAAVPAGANQQDLPVVSVVSPGRATIEGTINATGTLAARRALPVGVVGEGGRVVSVPFDAGEWVDAGQVLVVIDRSVQNQQAASAAAQVQVARADADLAQADLDRALQLVDRGFISTAEVDRLTAEREAARARVQVAEAQLGELRARNARLNVTAPASGLILERNVEPGQVVGGGTGGLFTIARGGEMELLARVGEEEVSRLSTGATAQVTPIGTNQTYTGQIWQLSPTIDDQSRQGTARIALSYAPGVRPGGFATATIRSGTMVAPVLPESAILSDSEGSYVYVIDGENRAQRRAVTTGPVTSDGVVVSEGLTGAERIVLRAGGFLTPGETVSPRLVEASEG